MKEPSGGTRLWQALDEGAAGLGVAPHGAVSEDWQPVWPGAVDRRQFFRLVEAALASAGLASCTLQPPEKILGYVASPPVDAAPSRPLYYTTTMPFAGYGLGILAEAHMGRPTKVDGGPKHPATLGKSHAFMQASVLDLYDPDRSRAVLHYGPNGTANTHSWSDLVTALQAGLEAQVASHGAGLRILTETVTSPTLNAQLQTLLRRFPKAAWARYEPLDADSVYDGAVRAFGRPVQMLPRLRQAKRILALGADFLADPVDGLRMASDFAAGRSPEAAAGMNRLYVIETTPSLTGAVADHRLAVTPADLIGIVNLLVQRVRTGVAAYSGTPKEVQEWVELISLDLLSERGASLVLVGRDQPASVHALGHLLNDLLGAVGHTVDYSEPVEASTASSLESLKILVGDMQAGKVQMLLILGGNPLWTAPVDLPFAEALSKVKLSLHHSAYTDETSVRCTWHAPASHYLESWGDLRAFDGTASLLQPLIRPLYDSKTSSELLSCLEPGSNGATGMDLVRNYWRDRLDKQHGDRVTDADFSRFWREALLDGVIGGTASPTVKLRLLPELRGEITASAGGPEPSGLVLHIRPDPAVWDGRYANNAWLQELPKPYSTLTWENAALIAPQTAQRLNLQTGAIVELSVAGSATVRAPVLVLPGQAKDTVTVTLGYGRTRGGSVAEGRGFNSYALRQSVSPWGSQGLLLQKTRATTDLALTQKHHSMEGREPARSVALGDLQGAAAKVAAALNAEVPPPQHTLYPPMPQGAHAWAMSIDLNACIGCSACTMACQAENNIPVVGKEQVLKGREMHWIRVDRYFVGNRINPQVRFQPVPCMQCENAPCELVCPVAATTHDQEGLNQMTYNRCVGTRYCSNNCPYKVRRFNFLTYNDPKVEALKLLHNPEVSVRERGVMEKCTYCVQRIDAARIDAARLNRPLRDGDITPACAAACPTSAIVFGDMLDTHSRVVKAKADPRSYALLAELNTRPRTTYLAQIRNPNPSLREGE